MLQALAHRWNRQLLTRLALQGAGIALPLVAIGYGLFRIPLWVCGVLWGVASASVFGLLLFLQRSRWATAHTVAQHLNRQYPQLEESAELLLAHPDTLPLLQRLQRERIAARLSDLPLTTHTPHSFKPALHAWLLGVGTAAMALGMQALFALSHAPMSLDLSALQLPPHLERFSVQLSPPRYTGKPPTRLLQPSFSFPEGSVAEFELHFSRPIASARLVFNARDTLSLHAQSRTVFRGTTDLKTGGFYTLEFEDEQHTLHTSEFYTLEMQPDQAPTILILEPMLRSEVDLQQRQTVLLSAQITDDYKVSAAHVVVTTAHGKGENITFKEHRLPLSAGNSNRYTLPLDLLALGLQPGDELYLYVEAIDTRKPKPHRSRSETHFVIIKDTADTDSDFSMSLPVAELPDYFRSQRQIIIDTEKLLREQKSLSAVEFNRRSEALGIDQKVLRLRYGKFLGEEFESAIGGTDMDEVMHAITPKDSAVHPLMKFVRHIHDEHCGHLKVPSEVAGTSTPTESVEKLMSRFMHIHDSEEGATFYSDDIKAQLKAALAEMWEAELYLRMHQPAQALPFELKALKLLKTLQYQSRLYVQRMGFEPPPLKPDEKRLSGKLEKIQSPTLERSAVLRDVHEPVRAAIAVLQRAKAGYPLTGIDLRTLERGGQQLAEAARHHPVRYLNALAALRYSLTALERGNTIAVLQLEPVEFALLSLLPPAEPFAQPSSLPSSSAAHAYFKAIQNIQ